MTRLLVLRARQVARGLAQLAAPGTVSLRRADFGLEAIDAVLNWRRTPREPTLDAGFDQLEAVH